MGLALALPLGLDVLVRNVRTATGDFSGAVSLSVFLKTGVTEARAEQLARTARERPGVATVQLITATQALAQFRAQSGFGAALDALEDNPLPHVLAITPRPANSNPADMESLRRYLKAWPEVDIVQLDGDWVTRFNAILRAAAPLAAAGGRAPGTGCRGRGGQHHPARDPEPPRRDRGHQTGRRHQWLRAPPVPVYRGPVRLARAG